jgi:hypothetical protein
MKFSGGNSALLITSERKSNIFNANQSNMNTSPWLPITSTYIKSMKIIFLALLAGQVMFAVLAWFMHRLGAYAGFESLVTLLLVLVPVLSASAIGIGIFIFNKRITELHEKSCLIERLND